MTEAENPEGLKALKQWLWDVVHFEETFPVPAYEYIDELLLALMVELHKISLEENRDLAMARYYSYKTQLLALQGRLLELLAEASKKQRKRIDKVDKGFNELLDLLELVKRERIDKLFFYIN